MRDSPILSVQELDLLDKWCTQATGSAGYVVVDLDELRGKPWDNPHYIKGLRREGETLELNVAWLSGQRTSGTVSGIQSVSESKHHWGPGLKLTGPLVWKGTQQSPPNDFAKLVGVLFKSFANPTVRPVIREHSHLILISLAVERS